MIRFLIPSLLIISLSNQAQAPFKNDSLYKRLYAKDLCALMQKDKNVQLIDVRTPGEHNDTSRWAGLNIGHLKGAVNIPVDSLLKSIDVLKPYQNKTIVFYCSHSQRSRKASKFLSENGWSNFYNLNGGMSNLNQMDTKDFPCKEEMLQSNTSYKNLSASQCAKLMDTEKALVIIDVRAASTFNSKDSMTWNNIGHLKKSLNLPYSDAQKDLGSIEKYKNSPILVCGDGGDAARFAKMLTRKGFSKVFHMLGGVYHFNAITNYRKYFDDVTPYIILNEKECLGLLKEKKDLVIFDARSEEDFYNKNEKDRSWSNLGHIKNAVHVPDVKLANLPTDKKTPVLIYGANESRMLAKIMCEKGYKNVYVLENYWDFVWGAFNIEQCKENMNYLVDHKGLY